MDAQSFITTILPYLYGILALAGVFALVQLGRLFGTSRKQLDEIGDKAQPIVEKADVSVDALNAELLRLDAILSDVEKITASAANTTQSLETVASAPLDIAGSIAERLRDLFKNVTEKKDADEAADPTEDDASNEHAWQSVMKESVAGKERSYVTSEGGAEEATSTPAPSMESARVSSAKSSGNK